MPVEMGFVSNISVTLPPSLHGKIKKGQWIVFPTAEAPMPPQQDLVKSKKDK